MHVALCMRKGSSLLKFVHILTFLDRCFSANNLYNCATKELSVCKCDIIFIINIFCEIQEYVFVLYFAVSILRVY